MALSAGDIFFQGGWGFLSAFGEAVNSEEAFSVLGFLKAPAPVISQRLLFIPNGS